MLNIQTEIGPCVKKEIKFLIIMQNLKNPDCIVLFFKMDAGVLLSCPEEIKLVLGGARLDCGWMPATNASEWKPFEGVISVKFSNS